METYICMYILPFCNNFVCLSTGVGTKIDPTLCRADRLVGQVCEHFIYLLGI